MLKQMQTQQTRTVIKKRSTIGTRLLVKCPKCNKTFSEAYSYCPYCHNKKFRR